MRTAKRYNRAKKRLQAAMAPLKIKGRLRVELEQREAMYRLNIQMLDLSEELLDLTEERAIREKCLEIRELHEQLRALPICRGMPPLEECGRFIDNPEGLWNDDLDGFWKLIEEFTGYDAEPTPVTEQWWRWWRQQSAKLEDARNQLIADAERHNWANEPPEAAALLEDIYVLTLQVIDIGRQLVKLSYTGDCPPEAVARMKDSYRLISQLIDLWREPDCPPVEKRHKLQELCDRLTNVSSDVEPLFD